MTTFIFYNADNITVEESGDEIRIGAPETVGLDELISVVNFQLGYDAVIPVSAFFHHHSRGMPRIL